MSVGSRCAVSIAAVLTLLGGASLVTADPLEPPAWAYPLNPTAPKPPPPDDGTILHAPDSAVGLTRAQTTDRFAAVDWRPDSHPPMPEAVAHGRKPDVFACGFCHFPNGRGRPESASLAGLSADYIVAQTMAMRDGSRKSSQPKMIASALMTTVAAHADPADVAAAAAYFAALPHKSWIRVVETDTVPRPEIHGVSAYAATADGSREPIGERIVELPENTARTDLRDDASGFVAYVPPGSIERGHALAAQAEGTFQPCGACHGADLRGALGPPLAGRSPSYLFRQMFDIQSGARSGVAVDPMKIEVSALTPAQMRDLSAYAASLAP
jgi:cytochrome c553